jgi:hypothetical protein
MFVIAGLEALINVGDEKVSKQFRERVHQLASYLAIPLTVDELKKAYSLRSKLVHAESFLHGLGNVLPVNQQNVLYDKLESVLRHTVRRAGLDDNFGEFFRDDTAVKTRWK